MNLTDKEPLNVVALTQGVDIPSTRFRVAQYMPLLSDLGVDITHLPAKPGSYPPQGITNRLGWLPRALCDARTRANKTKFADICLLQREMVSTFKTFESKISCPIVFDVDDAVHLSARFGAVDKISRNSAVIICGNNNLADYYSQFAPVEVVPTAVDVNRYKPKIKTNIGRKIIGWSGTSSGFKYLYMIEPALCKILKMNPSATFVIIADRPPNFKTLNANQIQFIPWSPSNEVSALQDFSVGIMPLVDDQWARGKCSYKMITYMSCAIPVVVSPVGMNLDILNMGTLGFAANRVSDWVDAIDFLLNNHSDRIRLGKVGRSIAEQEFSMEVIAPRIANVLYRVL
jgi:glycosyltransferase involved in cell wall biosynthesis